jgi:hypothetical protein
MLQCFLFEVLPEEVFLPLSVENFEEYLEYIEK